MANRLLTRKRALVLAGCVFCCAALVYGAQAATAGLQVVATGERISLNSEWTWAGSTGDLGGLPDNKSCGQETLTGAYAANLLSHDSSLQLVTAIDDSEIMNFSSGLQLTGGKTILKEYTSVFDSDTGATVGNCEAANLSTTYNEFAGAGSMFMGDALRYQSVSAVSQADDVIPDSLRVQVHATGSGRIEFTGDMFSQIGIGNTSAIGQMNELHQQAAVSGKAFEGGMLFEFNSFKPPMETIAAAGIEGALPTVGG